MNTLSLHVSEYPSGPPVARWCYTHSTCTGSLLQLSVGVSRPCTPLVVHCSCAAAGGFNGLGRGWPPIPMLITPVLVMGLPGDIQCLWMLYWVHTAGCASSELHILTNVLCTRHLCSRHLSLAYVVLLGVIPFAGATFMFYEMLDRAWGKPKWQMSPVENFINGCAAAAFAQVFVHAFVCVCEYVCVCVRACLCVFGGLCEH